MNMKQTWDIQSTYLRVRDYLEAIAGVADIDRKVDLFKQLVDPECRCFSDQQQLGKLLRKGLMFDPFEGELGWLSSHLDDIRRAGVQLMIAQSLTRCQSFIPSLPGIVWILPGAPPNPLDSQKFSRANSVRGDAILQGMRLYISPINGWQDWVKPVVAHEYNHYVRLQAGGARKTLLDYLILEGIAEAFARKVFPRPATPWTEEDFITEEEVLRVWKAMYPDHKASEREVIDVIDKHMEGKGCCYVFLPCEKRVTIGCTIGHRIVQDYAEQKYAGQEVDWAELTQLPSEVILGGSHFAAAG